MLLLRRSPFTSPAMIAAASARAAIERRWMRGRAAGSARSRRIEVLTIIASLLWVASADAAFPGQNGRIAMRAQTTNQIVTLNPDGSGPETVTAGNSSDPDWSPDGHRIAFTNTPPISAGVPTSIAVMNADGSGRVSLTTGLNCSPTDPVYCQEGGDRNPAWSPDGQRIAFTSFFGVAIDMSHIQVVNADGSGRTVIRSAPAGDGVAWSPDGRTIAFCPGNPMSIAQINPDGGSATTIVNGPSGFGETGGCPDWSPDGRRLVFGLIPPSSPSNAIYTVNGDGSDLRKIADGRAPAWSPDGQKIVIAAAGGLLIMNADGSGQERVPGTEGGGQPDWGSAPLHPALSLTADAKRTQKLGRLSITASCGSTTACSMSASASVSISGSSKLYNSRKVKRSLPAGKTTRLRIKFPSRAKKVIVRALKRGKRLKARVRLVARTPSDSAIARRAVRLRR
jgi:WD40 repeat protein